MEEKKLSVEIQKRDLSQHVQRLESPERLNLKQMSSDAQNYYTTAGLNDNWYELRFGKVGPDRRSYHASFVHNKKYFSYNITFI